MRLGELVASVGGPAARTRPGRRRECYRGDQSRSLLATESMNAVVLLRVESIGRRIAGNRARHRPFLCRWPNFRLGQRFLFMPPRQSSGIRHTAAVRQQQSAPPHQCVPS